MSEMGRSEIGLAEGRWLWRRLYVFVASAGLWLLLARAVGRTAPADLPRVADGLMGLIALMLVLYLVAPTRNYRYRHSLQIAV